MHGGGVVIIIAFTAAFVVLCASFCFLWLVRHSFSLSLLAQYVIKSTKNEQISKSFHKMNAPSRMHPKNYWHKSADKHKMKTALNSLRFSYGRVFFFHRTFHNKLCNDPPKHQVILVQTKCEMKQQPNEKEEEQEQQQQKKHCKSHKSW